MTEFLQEIYEAAGTPLSVGSRFDDFREILERRLHVLVKIHGEYFDDANRILDKEDYDAFYGVEKKRRSYRIPFNSAPRPPVNSTKLSSLRHLFSTESLLFIGCSMKDDRYLTVLADIPLKPTHYAILPYDTCRERHKRLLDCGVRPIWYVPINGDHMLVGEVLEFLRGRRSVSIPRSSFRIQARPEEEILDLIGERLRAAIGISDFENTAFAWALRYRRRGKPASIRFSIEASAPRLISFPPIHVAGQNRPEPIILLGQAFRADGSTFLATTGHPISVLAHDEKGVSLIDEASGIIVDVAFAIPER